MIESWEIAGGILEYIDETHTYIFDGVILPSITQILKIKFGNKYKDVSDEVLKKASERGTKVHQAIEDYEVRNKTRIACRKLRNIMSNDENDKLYDDDKKNRIVRIYECGIGYDRS